ncbi:RNA-guided endonuclease InsQ/TnpB family protein [Janthinobacterium sp. HLX7-2]|uniref:RNA-guided endonuclease InsQ/TnpB family protein n=1 Tax=Janthinobacterium sp. HLX7-2 TaxID=1259331 RepID=UPI003F28EB8C
MPFKKSLTHSTRVLRLRLKDKHAAALSAMTRDVNFVWNYANDLSFKVWQRERRFLSEYDIDTYTAGATKEGLNLHSTTVQAISKELVTRRRQFKKVKLRWRISRGSRRSLGWIPFKASALRYRNGQLLLSGLGTPLCLWDSYGLSAYQLGAGNLSEDARGRWYINITVKTQKAARSTGRAAVGIDLGLKDFAATSGGVKIAAQQFYRDLEPALALAQRAGKTDRARAIHAKIGNRRKDFLHKLSTRLVAEHGAIFVGDVNASGLAKTRMEKSVLDAGWSMFRTMLHYKSDDAGVWFEEVNEAYSTQTCSACDAHSGPRGLQGLGIREWSCSNCGAVHDRDVNSANIILARGYARLAGGIPFLSA